MTPPRSILIVEDQKDLADMLTRGLEREGFACRTVRDGRAALAEAERQPPDIILLDRMLPVLSGDEAARRLRASHRTARVPILMLTAKGEELDQIVGLSLGADDYVTKPFSMQVLIARINAILRRAETGPTSSGEVFTQGPVVLDVARHEVTVDGLPVVLTATEFRLMRALMAAGGRVLSRDNLIDKALGAGVVVNDRTIDVHITALRKKLAGVAGGAAARWVQTVRGVGYTYRQPEEKAV
ncbi:MAG: response regulator transcription factor [Phycisphaerae bacterium]|nr:MAG: DNA-binding response regulator [Planctomycetota bacterium]KAB2946215.1 MAG: response regulator transcription factor [Phycisphaerae bacterium]MBE7455449.1 response regulator transcription factor [Planctomycetia bacterium]MCK6464953.1 response regulator transcription factor [Phycisphaerae bacterium]MCL4719420.1 response regulator transcription factor [Phycisphaerae bacterium]